CKPRYAFCVDEDLADLESGDEGRRHSGTVSFEELDQVEMRADGDDQLRALFVGEEQREIFADPSRRNDLVRDAELSRALGSRCEAVAITVNEEIRPGPKRLVRDRVHVADDHVGLVSL